MFLLICEYNLICFLKLRILIEFGLFKVWIEIKSTESKWIEINLIWAHSTKNSLIFKLMFDTHSSIQYHFAILKNCTIHLSYMVTLNYINYKHKWTKTIKMTGLIRYILGSRSVSNVQWACGIFDKNLTIKEEREN